MYPIPLFYTTKDEVGRFWNGMCATVTLMLFVGRAHSYGTLANLQECIHLLHTAKGPNSLCPSDLSAQALASAQGQAEWLDSLFWALLAVTIVSFLGYMLWYKKSLGHKAWGVFRKLRKRRADRLEYCQRFAALMDGMVRDCPERVPDLEAVARHFKANGREENA